VTNHPSSPSQTAGVDFSNCPLPDLATASEVAGPLKVTSRTITAWAEAGKIPVALRQGRILRFHPASVWAALGIVIPGMANSLSNSTEQPSAAKK
jgi:hypothetical protein